MLGARPIVALLAVAATCSLGVVCQPDADDALEASNAGQASTAYSAYVDSVGNISLPTGYRTGWQFLGAWAVANESDQGPGSQGIHSVYAEPGTIEAYRENGEFPDGSVIVKEVLGTETAEMTTGQVSRGGAIQGWFVMIKDTEGRFPDHPLWGDGWGWVWFNADDPGQAETQDYKAECIPCHIPARETDWTYVQGYPPLNTEGGSP